ncbi:hypothetical protein E1J38_012360 [Seonamhaeicola sediminis]|uniref:Uncharacterized protein n=1 Tax=Seonamhaeicola sediminis TaxID=2528206 RepID=A0A562YBC0_9FLAO|nr:hypothetical protein [Seonamhaeicola sediminis]TWO31689.1 hypothetical protein E1J38_012360 [Seonamhaeicola sediminis]
MELELINRALEFEQRKMRGLSTSDRVKISREAKTLILDLNQIYKAKKDEKIMDIMKRLTAIKRKVEKRLLGKHLTAGI